MSTTPITIVDDFSLTTRNPLGLTSDGQATWADSQGTWGVDNQTLTGQPAQNFARGMTINYVHPNSYTFQSFCKTFLPLPGISNVVINLTGFLRSFMFGTVYQSFQLYFAYTDANNFAYWEIIYSGSGSGAYFAFDSYYVVAGVATQYWGPNAHQFVGSYANGGIVVPLNIVNLNVTDELNAMSINARNALTGSTIGFLDYFNDQGNTTATNKFAFLSKLTIQGILTSISVGTLYSGSLNPIDINPQTGIWYKFFNIFRGVLNSKLTFRSNTNPTDL